MDANIVVFNPDYHLKNDINRIVLYSTAKVINGGSQEWVSFIHPLHAFILEAFDGIKEWDEALSYLSLQLKKEKDKLAKLLFPFINNAEPFYTEWKGVKVKFPPFVLVTIDRLSQQCRRREKFSLNPQWESVDLISTRFQRAPHSLIFMVTNRCVTDCKYCYADKRSGVQELSTNQVLRLIEDAKRLQMTKINVIGGELFLKKDWDIILKSLVDNNLTPDYISTKVPLTERMVLKLRDTGYTNVVQISLDALDSFSLQKILNVEVNYVDKIKKTILLLQKYDFKIQVNTLLTTYNSTKEQIKTLYEYISTFPNILHWEIRTPFKSIYRSEGFREIKPDGNRLVDLYAFIKNQIVPNSKFSIYSTDFSLFEKFNCESCKSPLFNDKRCGVLYDKCFVLPDGKVTICEELYWIPQFIIGDLKKQSIEEIWNSPKALSLFEVSKQAFRAISACKECVDFDFCIANHKRCWMKIVKAYGVENWDYPDPHCEKAPLVDKDLTYIL